MSRPTPSPHRGDHDDQRPDSPGMPESVRPERHDRRHVEATANSPTLAAVTQPPEHPADKQPPEDLSYEQAREELADVVRRLETGGLSLEESLSLWERGERLAGICQLRLDGARQRLAAILEVPTEPGPGTGARG